jgi:hypothetical protein
VIDILTRKCSFLVRNVCAKRLLSAKTCGFICAKDGPGVNQPYDNGDDDESMMPNY